MRDDTCRTCGDAVLVARDRDGNRVLLEKAVRVWYVTRRSHDTSTVARNVNAHAEHVCHGAMQKRVTAKPHGK